LRIVLTSLALMSREAKHGGEFYPKLREQ
jgi:hypothetical protein